MPQVNTVSFVSCSQDYARAFELFQKAADKGSAEAQYYLGHMFHGMYPIHQALYHHYYFMYEFTFFRGLWYEAQPQQSCEILSAGVSRRYVSDCAVDITV